jgi:hypothetical protein
LKKHARREVVCSVVIKQMEIPGLLEQLRELALALPREGCPWEGPAHFEPPATSAEVEAAVLAAGGQLPDDVVTYLHLCGGIAAMTMHNGYWLSGARDIASQSFRENLPMSIVVSHKSESVIPIATDGGGNAFLLSVKTGRVWRWNHENDEVRPVTSSFTEFLHRVVEDWTAYITDKPDWKYLV